ncbi:MAG: AAA family ATPase, partial [Candidatus Binatia bacterium]
HLRAQSALIEGLFAAKPHLSVVAIGETLRKDLLLAAMRASVRDFIAFDSDPMEIQDLLDRVLAKPPHPGGSTTQGQLFAFLCGLPGPEAATLAVHAALALQERTPGEPGTLLLDLGVPSTVSLLYLDLKPSYTFVDAARSVRRFDETLIKTAFVRHRSGLTVLPMPEGGITNGQPVTVMDALILLNTLKSYFSYIVVNLGGFELSDLLCQILGKSEQVILMAEQSVLSCNANKKLLDFLAVRDFPISKVGLVIDRYDPNIGLDTYDIAELMSLPVLGTAPSNGMVRLNAMNTGRNIFDMAPKDSYARAVRGLTDKIANNGQQVRTFAKASPASLWNRVRRSVSLRWEGAV